MQTGGFAFCAVCGGRCACWRCCRPEKHACWHHAASLSTPAGNNICVACVCGGECACHAGPAKLDDGCGRCIRDGCRSPVVLSLCGERSRDGGKAVSAAFPLHSFFGSHSPASPAFPAFGAGNQTFWEALAYAGHAGTSLRQGCLVCVSYPTCSSNEFRHVFVVCVL